MLQKSEIDNTQNLQVNTIAIYYHYRPSHSHFQNHNIIIKFFVTLSCQTITRLSSRVAALEEEVMLGCKHIC